MCINVLFSGHAERNNRPATANISVSRRRIGPAQDSEWPVNSADGSARLLPLSTAADFCSAANRRDGPEAALPNLAAFGFRPTFRPSGFQRFNAIIGLVISVLRHSVAETCRTACWR